MDGSLPLLHGSLDGFVCCFLGLSVLVLVPPVLSVSSTFIIPVLVHVITCSTIDVFVYYDSMWKVGDIPSHVLMDLFVWLLCTYGCICAYNYEYVHAVLSSYCTQNSQLSTCRSM